MIRFRKLNCRYVDLEFSPSADFTVRIVERPGLWMSDKELEEVLADLRSVVTNCLGRSRLEYGVLSGARARLGNAIVTVLYERKCGRPIAFSTPSALDFEMRGRKAEIIHLGLAMIDPAFRGRGLSSLLYGPACLLLLARNRLRPVWMSNVTQVPAVVGKVAQALTNVYPTPDPKNKRTFAHLAIARHIMRHHRGVFGVAKDAGFDEERFIITNAYTGGSDNLKKTFADAPKHRQPAFNSMCRAQLDYERGDDFLQIGQLDLRTAGHYLLHSISNVSSLALLLSAAFHWIAPARDAGQFHPWHP